MTKKTLSTLRVEVSTISNMEIARKKFNQDPDNLIEIRSKADFRRFSYELFSQMILQDKNIPVKLK